MPVRPDDPAVRAVRSGGKSRLARFGIGGLSPVS
jgi:hypothetical protein